MDSEIATPSQESNQSQRTYSPGLGCLEDRPGTMVLVLYALILAASLWVLHRVRTRRRRWRSGRRWPLRFGFFHPHCAAGGGGERVLWHMVRVLQRHRHSPDGGGGEPSSERIRTIIYTVDPPASDYKERLLRDVKARFSIEIAPDTVDFVHLYEYRDLLRPAPRLSMLVESWNTVRLARQGLRRVVPDVWVDTTGCAFTFIAARIAFGVPHTVAYVHYPTVSTDMLRLVYGRRRTALTPMSPSPFHAAIKCAYYGLFALLYGLVGGCLCRCVLVNSTWTFQHIRSLWWYAARRGRIRIVYPPCGDAVDANGSSPNDDKTKQGHRQCLVSVGQFRPEKDHSLQLEVMARLLQRHPELRGKVQLVLVGSCRGPEDEARLARLQTVARDELGLEDGADVRFLVNAPFAAVQATLRAGRVGLHTMWNEHFGIGIVEMMAAGLLVVAHDSGGPKSDIVVPYHGQPTGFLASSVDGYVDAIYKALTMPKPRARAMQKAARKSTERFTDDVFAASIERALLDAGLL